MFNAYQHVVDGGKERQIRRFLEDVPYESVLDVGCGTGNWADLSNSRYMGLDVSERFVEEARERYRGRRNMRFLVLDPTRDEVPGRFDLVQLISVLHHLSDRQVRTLLKRVMPGARYLFVLDLYPIPWHPVARVLYAADRGDYIRPPEDQRALIESCCDLKLLREDDYFAPTGLYRHTLLLYERQ